MKIEIYCDESRPDLFTSQRKDAAFLSIGGIWIPAASRDRIKSAIKSIREKHNIHGEIKWTKVSAKALPFYCDLVDYFFSDDDIRFRTILVDSTKTDLIRYHSGDAELGFFKFYYQLLHHWILESNEYSIFLDMKTYRNPQRITTLRNFLRNSNILASVSNIQSLPSTEVILIQLADLFTGAVNAKFNVSMSSQTKLAIIDRIEHHLKKNITPTCKSESKFNVFQINLEQF